MQNFESKRTIYKGICFRSKLEARWAVVFDQLGIEWVYEPDTLSRDWVEMVYYRPDFYLPELGKYVEVKPNDEKLFEIQEKLSVMVDFGGPLAEGIIILGTIPNSTEITNYLPAFSYLYNYKACVLGYVTFYGDELWIVDKDVEFTDCCDYQIPKSTSTKCRWVKCEDSAVLSFVRKAYDAGWYSNEMKEA